VLLAGGVSTGERDLRSTRVFNPASDRWQPSGSLHTRRDSAAGALLPDGEVLMAGGEQVTFHVLRSAELYDERSHAWSPAAPMLTPRDAATSSRLPGGSVLVCGGTNLYGVLDSCEVYHP
jgi:hypothetical protein